MSDPDEDDTFHSPRASEVLLPALFGLAWPPTPGMQASAGRLHPMLVHFPIALLLAAALFEGLRVLLRRRGPSPVARAVLPLAALGAAVAAGTGWLYAAHDPPGRSVEDLLDLHRWCGVGTAVVACVAWVAALLCRAPRPDDEGDHARRGPLTAYRVLLLVGAGLVSFTGHLGGELVYGEGFVLEPWQRESEVPPSTPASDGATRATSGAASGATSGAAASDGAPPASEGGDVTHGDGQASGSDGHPGDPATAPEVEFTADVLPLFEARCFECHGPRKQKGKLRLDVGADLFAGDRSRWAIVPGDADASPVFERISLPAWDPDRMPAEGDALSPEQIDLVKRWIDGGALWDGVAVPAPVGR